MPDLDIVVPVYNEGTNILAMLQSLEQHVRTSYRVLICYDSDDDDTLPAIERAEVDHTRVALVKSTGRGPHAAVMSGLKAGGSPFVLVIPADDDYNAPILDTLVTKALAGAAIVCASRFMPGGAMVGCPLLKAVLVRTANFTLRHFAGLPTHDATNGLRLFTRRVIDEIPVQSKRGFTYSIELLVKVHRLGWPIAEVPVLWYERRKGRSRFMVIRWLSDYLVWYVYAFKTRLLHLQSPSMRGMR